MDYGPIVKAILFALFGALTAAVSVVTGPTYDNLFVPEMDPSAAYASWQGGNVFAAAASFSNALLVGLVDPLCVLVIAAVGLLYLVRSAHPTPKLQGLAAKLVMGILVANLVLPITSGIWQLAAGVYPSFYDYGGGAWRSYTALVGPGAISLSWDNGVLAFVVSWTLFGMVLLLAFLLAFRGAIVAVLLVLLPPLTLLWPIPGAGSLARKVWVLFIEMTFLPCFLVVPLVLAVGSTSVLLTMGLFSVALAMPQILSISGASLSHAGFPNASFVVGSSLLRNSEATQGWTSGLLRKGGSSFARGFRSPSSSRSSGQGAAGAPAGAGAPGGSLAGKAAPAMRAGGASSSGLALAGPAGLAAWGLQEGLGRLAELLGRRAARSVATSATNSSGGAQGSGEVASPPPRAKADERFGGTPRPEANAPLPSRAARAGNARGRPAPRSAGARGGRTRSGSSASSATRPRRTPPSSLRAESEPPVPPPSSEGGPAPAPPNERDPRP